MDLRMAAEMDVPMELKVVVEMVEATVDNLDIRMAASMALK